MRRAGATTGAWGMGPLTTADSVPVTRAGVPTLLLVWDAAVCRGDCAYPATAQYSGRRRVIHSER
jgi:hypothetical protein